MIPTKKIMYQIFSILSNEDNIRVLNFLLDTPLKINDLIKKMNEPFNKIQKQLDILEKNHFIKKRFVENKHVRNLEYFITERTAVLLEKLNLILNQYISQSKSNEN
ncbi:MAG: hypothetical protein HWN67_08060 [Candidatus Helarchaeota archaeon]|nr:hypothetical protein [Candidatus Helarchaeota archaeon]